jgi:hypothetical protein
MAYLWYGISRVLITTMMVLSCPDKNLDVRVISQ